MRTTAIQLSSLKFVSFSVLKSLKFFLFSSSYFAQTLTGDIYPAEIAMAKFSLANGIEDTLHSLINPGPLPLGTSHEALRHSDTTHKRKLPPNIDGETDYFVILDMVLKFLGVDGSKKKRVPIIFVEPGVIQEDYKASKLTLEKLLIETGENVNFRLYPLENLLFKLQKKCISLQILSQNVQLSSIEMAKEMMARNKFIYSDIGCDFHTHSDANCHCCLAKVKSWVFMIALYCLNNSDVKIPGQHFPKNSSTLSEKPMLVADLDWEDDMNSNFSKISIHKEITFSQHSCISLPCSDISAKSSSITMCNDEELNVGSDEPLHPINSKVSLSARVLSKRGGKRT